jgi:hypothetical protein
MTNTKQSKPKPKPTIDESTRMSVRHIRQALEASGYPLEVRLFAELASLRVEPGLGLLVSVSDGGPLREVDLTARLHRFGTSTVVRDGETQHRSLRVERRLLIGVKKLQKPRRFVGIEGNQPNPLSRRNLRGQILGGLPSRGVSEVVARTGVEELLLQTGFGSLLDVGVNVPTCVHWAITRWRRREKEMEPYADSGQDATGDRYFKDLETTCLAAFALSQAVTMESLDPDRMLHAMVVSYQPVLVIDTPELYLYDPTTKKLRRTDWLTLQRGFKVPGLERAVHWMIDVLTPKAVARYIAATRTALNAGFDAADKYGVDVHPAVMAQSKNWAEKQAAESQASIVQRMNAVMDRIR